MAAVESPPLARQRRVLDLHNLTGVAALPFHFYFAFTGMLIFSAELFPGQELVLGSRQTDMNQPRRTVVVPPPPPTAAQRVASCGRDRARCAATLKRHGLVC